MNSIATDEKPEGAFRYFSDEEFNTRWGRVRERMADAGLDACIITNPENVYYLTGLHHQGYFAYTSLILPLNKEPILISRAMEKAIVRDMLVPGVVHCPYSDGVPLHPGGHGFPVDVMVAAHRRRGCLYL